MLRFRNVSLKWVKNARTCLIGKNVVSVAIEYVHIRRMEAFRLFHTLNTQEKTQQYWREEKQERRAQK